MSQQSGSDSNPTNFGDERSGCEPPVVRDHTLLRRIGKGSYGDVWLARSSTGAFRAVKIVYRRAFHDVRPFDREFSGIKKFEPLSRSHEGFIDILQVGINEDEEYFYYIMELGDDDVTGQQIDPASYTPKTLSKMMRQRERLPVAECVTLALALSRALVELHKNKLVHRDIKPSNIIFINGCPKLADIGLVATLDEARSYVGTEGFIPPEGPGTPQADIYSLGKVLYEIATGRDRNDFPDLPDLNELPDRDAFLEFNEVIIKACNGNAQQRYQSAAELHADLLILENGKSVRRLHTLERRFVAVKRAATVAAVALLIASMIGYEIYSQWRRREDARQTQLGAEIAYGNAAMESGDYLGALPHFTKASLLDRANKSHDRLHQLRIGSLLEFAPKLTHMWKQPRLVCDVEFSPDGKSAAFSELDNKTYLYNLETRQLSKPFGATLGESVVCFSKDGSRIATCSGSGVCGIWNVTNLALVGRLVHPTGVHSVQFSADGRQLLSSCDDGIARLWNADDARVAASWKHGTGLLYANLSHDGKSVVTVGLDDTAKIWNVSSTNPVRILQHTGWVYYATFSPDDTKVVTACGDHKARLWDVASGRQMFPELTHLDSVQSAEFSRDGKLILTASLDGTARLWRADTLTPVSENSILKHTDRLSRARFDATGRKVIYSGVDGTVAIWDFSECSKTPQPSRITNTADAPAFTELSTNELPISEVSKWLNPLSDIDKVTFSRQRHTLVVRKKNSGQVEVWNVSAQKLITKINTPFTNCIPNDDGTRMLAYDGRWLHVWTFSASTNPVTLRHASDINSVAFNPDGDAVMTVSGKAILVWDASTGNPRFGPLEFSMPVVHAEFSPDGTMIAGCCSDRSYRSGEGQVFDAKTGKPLSNPLWHSDGVLWITFSPDSKRVATASEDFTAMIWDPQTGVHIGNPMMHREKVLHAIFSDDGKMLATMSWDHTMRLWNAETGDPLTPRLPCESRRKPIIFTSTGLAIRDSTGDWCLWPIPQNLPNAEDLDDVATLLAGSNSKSVVGGRTGSRFQPAEGRWARLHTRYPALFTIH